jgi:predicted MFS family arabinose efflux permease
MPSRQLAAVPRAGTPDSPADTGRTDHGRTNTAPTNRVHRRDVPVWVSLLALAVGGFAIGTTEFASMGVLPDIAGDLGVSIPQAGHAITAYALGVVIGAPTFAILGAGCHARGCSSALMAALTVANLASALAPTFGSLVVARFASGFPHGAYFGIGRSSPPRWCRGTAGPAPSR